MSKSRSLSIYLLKDGYDATNALKVGHGLDASVTGERLPADATLFVADNDSTEPWWKDYFGISIELKQCIKGAIIFLPVGGRTFAITFGHTFHSLEDTSYEYDFGLKTTLNCIDPDELKSTDVVEPGGAKRRRTQLPSGADLTYFDFEQDNTILKGLTGKVKEEYKELFKNVTGASNVRVSSAVESTQLSDLCQKLYGLYQDETYKASFPNIQNISPIRDPDLITSLNDKLVEAIKNQDESLALSVPDIVDYNAEVWATFAGVGKSLVYESVTLSNYYDYLEKRKFLLSSMSLDILKNHQVVLAFESGVARKESYSIFKSLIFDTVLGDSQNTYHLCEGLWYLISHDYVTKMQTYLDPFCAASVLPVYAHENEGDFNEKVSLSSDTFVCLDRKNISPMGQKQIEPCDIFELFEGQAVLHHVKISTDSSMLSHLFNQGVNSVKLLRSESESMDKLKHLLDEAIAARSLGADFKDPLDKNVFKIVFDIVTKKDPQQKSLNLPIFSRISLMRAIKELVMMNVDVAYSFVPDQAPPKPAKKKTAQSRKAKKVN